MNKRFFGNLSTPLLFKQIAVTQGHEKDSYDLRVLKSNGLLGNYVRGAMQSSLFHPLRSGGILLFVFGVQGGKTIIVWHVCVVQADVACRH